MIWYKVMVALIGTLIAGVAVWGVVHISWQWFMVALGVIILSSAWRM